MRQSNKNWLRHFHPNRLPIKSLGFWVTIWTIVVLAAGVVVFIYFWDRLSETDSTKIRNIGLLIAGVIALPLAIWRSWIGERQVSTAQQNLLNERYQKGAEMLGDSVLSVRLGGIYALQHLAEDHPEQYHIQIMRLFCAFMRHPTEDSSMSINEHEDAPSANKQKNNCDVRLREDVESVLQAIATRSEQDLEIEKKSGFQPHLYATNLHAAKIRGLTRYEVKLRDIHLNPRHSFNENLSNIVFSDVDLSNADLDFTNMSYAEFEETNLSGAHLSRANLSRTSWIYAIVKDALLDGADLSQAIIQETNLSNANLSGADLSGVVFEKTDLSGVNLSGANLSGTNLSITIWNRSIVMFPVEGGTSKAGVRNLTQVQLDLACADPNNPPRLDSVIDAETGKPLVWRGKPI